MFLIHPHLGYLKYSSYRSLSFNVFIEVNSKSDKYRTENHLVVKQLLDLAKTWHYQYSLVWRGKGDENVTLFGKTGLNEICVRMHFNAFWMHYNAFQRSPMIRNALTTFPIDRWQFCLMFHNDFPTFFNALATFPNILIPKAFPLWPGNYKHQHVRTLKMHCVLERLQKYVATS